MKRNVLWIIADQFRSDCLGVAGNPVIQTPNLDALAKEGMFFSNCYVQAAPCGPSRSCMLSSRYLCGTRVVDNKTPMADAHEALPMALSNAGVTPYLIGYNDYAVDPRTLPADDPRTRGLDYNNALPGYEVLLYQEHDSPEYFAHLRDRGYPESRLNNGIHEPNVPVDGPGDHLPLWYPAHYVAEDSPESFLTSRAVEFLKTDHKDPWMLSLNLIKPHPPRVCPAPFHRMYDPATMPTPLRRAGEWEAHHRYWHEAHPGPQLVSEQEWRETKANYYGMISHVDACVGRLFDALRETGQWHNTLVIFMSDHGEYLGDHYLTDKGGYFDATMRVPLIIRDPSIEADATRGTASTALCESIDLAPTVLYFWGASVPDRFQGVSLKPVLHGRSATHKAAVHYEFDYRNRLRSGSPCHPDTCLLWVYRTDEFKYVQFADPEYRPVLFDLRKDPGEFCDLADEPAYAGTVAACAQAMLRWRMRHEDQRMERWASQYRT